MGILNKIISSFRPKNIANDTASLISCNDIVQIAEKICSVQEFNLFAVLNEKKKL